jgi:hypothetical protein
MRVLLGKLYKRLYHDSIVTDKLIIKVIKTEEGLDSLYSIRGFLVTDSFHLFNINFDSFYSDNEPEVLYISYPKFAFLDINL